MNRFALLDRDGTINVEREYLADPAGVELLPNAAAGLRDGSAASAVGMMVASRSPGASASRAGARASP